MREIILYCIALFGISSAAMAADLPRRDYAPAPSFVQISAPFTWTGFYAGVNAGYSWGKFSSSNVEVFGVPQPGSSGNLDGVIGGIQAGYNQQFGSLVVGVEADFQGTSGAKSGSAFPSAPGFATQAELNWFGTVRGRVGLAFDKLLVYGTGGLAYAGIDGSLNEQTTNRTHFGYVYGAGVEYAFNDRWSAKAEYLRMDYGKKSYSIAPASATGSFKADVARVGLNYRF